jgi:serine protease Do
VKRSLIVLVVLLCFFGLYAPGYSAEGGALGWLGVRIRDLSEQEMEDLSARHGIQEGFGVVIVEVMRGAPAASSGLKSGDLVVAFKERPVTDVRVLQRLVGGTPVGDEVALTVLGDGGRRAVKVRVGAMPQEAVADRIAAEFGFTVRESLPDSRGGEPSGHAAVAAVLPGSLAERAGLRAGDFIVGVNGDETPSPRAVSLALSRASPEKPLHLVLGRGPERVGLTIGSPFPPPPRFR